MVAVEVGQDDQLDPARIEAKGLHARHDDLFDVVDTVEGVDQDEPIRGFHHPGPDVGATDVIQVVEELRRCRRRALAERHRKGRIGPAVAIEGQNEAALGYGEGLLDHRQSRAVLPPLCGSRRSLGKKQQGRCGERGETGHQQSLAG